MDKLRLPFRHRAFVPVVVLLALAGAFLCATRNRAAGPAVGPETPSAPTAGGDLDLGFAPAIRTPGTVNSVAMQADNKVIIGGNFITVNGVARGRIARLNADGTLDTSFGNALAGANNSVLAVAVQADNKVIIGGGFTTVNGMARGGIARLNPDGTLDTSFGNALAGTFIFVEAVAVQADNKVIIGGNFNTVNGVARGNIARLNADGTLDTSFGNALAGANSVVFAVAVQADNKVIIGGQFTTVNGVARGFIARLNPDGTLDTSFGNGLVGANSSVFAVALQADNKVIIGGQFTTVNGVARVRIARLNPDGTLDTAFGNALAGANNPVFAVAVQADNKVIIGGFFTAVNGVARGRIARLNADGTLDTSFGNALAGAESEVRAVAVQADNKVIIGGFFSTVNGVARGGIARLNADGTLDTSFTPAIENPGSVYAVAMQADNKVIIGGFFAAVNGVARGRIARLNANGTLDQTFSNALVAGTNNFDSFVEAVAVQADNKVIIGGQFITVNGVARGNIARLNADGTLDTSFGNALAGASFPLYAVAVQADNKVIIGGGFTSVNGMARVGIARLNADGTLDQTFGNALAGTFSTVRAVAVQADNKVIIGGSFTTVNGVARGNIARLNADGTLDTSFSNPLAGANNTVNSVAVQTDNKVIIGGFFTNVNGVARGRIARLNADGTLDTSFGNPLVSGTNNFVRTVAVQADNKVFIGGQFTSVNGVARGNIARLNADGTLDTSFGNALAGAESEVRAVAVQADNKVIIGGEFSTVNGVARFGIARLLPSTPGTLQFSAAIYSGNENSGTATITVTRSDNGGAAAVNFATGSATATGGAVCSAGVDYVNTSGTLNWANGDAAPKSFPVTLCNDNVFEGNETVNLTLSNATGATLGAPNTAVLTINDDETQPTIALTDVTQNEGNSGTTNFVFTVALANASTQTVMVNYGTANGTATAGSDYTATSGTLTFAPGQTTRPVTVAVNGDTTPEPDETFSLNLTTPVNATISDGLGIGTITNDDFVLSISGRVQNSSNQGLPDITVTLSGPVSGTAVTNQSGGYAFNGLQPGGNYTVIAANSAFTFTPPRADFANLSANQTQNFTAQSISPPAIPPLMDSFPPRPNPDPTLWNLGILTEAPGSFDPQVTVSQTTGQLVISPRARVAGPHYNGYATVNNYDLTNGQVSVELVQPGAGGSNSIFSIGTDFQNFARFLVQSPLPNQPLIIEEVRNGVKHSPVEATMPMLMFQLLRDGVVILNVAIPYDPVAHRFLRLRHVTRDNNNNPISSMAFESSPDAGVWTEHARGPYDERTVHQIMVELAGGTTGTAGNPGPVIFDNLGMQLVNSRFDLAAYSVNESAGFITVTVRRSGGPPSFTSAVDYFTADGNATQRTRYVAASGTLNFTGNETMKTLTILLNDNALVDGAQTFDILLSNPITSGVNAPGRTVVTINDNDVPPITTNPLETPTYFVTQQYYDFLSRAPDQAGLNFWVGQIVDPCGGNAACISQRRWNVSNAFFFELEFQQTGSYVYRLYRAAYGNTQPFPNTSGDMDAHPFCTANPANCQLIRAAHVPNYAKFINDRARLDAGNLAATQLALANAFALRSEFRQRYPVTQTAAQFVDALLANIQTASGANLTSQRDALIALHGSGGRGAILYRLADDNTLGNPINNRSFIDAEYSRSFVLTQYFGYLRRDPDMPGLNFWLGIINRFPLRAPTGQNAMVCAFITSGEYQTRFSAVVTRTDSECPTPP